MSAFKLLCRALRDVPKMAVGYSLTYVHARCGRSPRTRPVNRTFLAGTIGTLSFGAQVESWKSADCIRLQRTVVGGGVHQNDWRPGSGGWRHVGQRQDQHQDGTGQVVKSVSYRKSVCTKFSDGNFPSELAPPLEAGTAAYFGSVWYLNSTALNLAWTASDTGSGLAAPAGGDGGQRHAR